MQMCSVMHELWMDTRETGGIGGPCGGRQTTFL